MPRSATCPAPLVKLLDLGRSHHGGPGTGAGRRRATPGARRRRRVTVIAGGIAAAAILAGSAAAVYAERGALRTGLHAAGQAAPGWVAAGAAAQCLSMAAFVLLQHRLLKAAGAKLTFTWLLATDYASNTISLAVPIAGSGMAAAYSLRKFTNRGADAATVSLALLIAGVISAVTFAVIAAIATVASGTPVAAVAGLLTSLGAAAAAALTMVVLRSPGGRARLCGPAASVIALSQRLVRRPAGNPAEAAATWLERLGAARLTLPAIGSAFGWALVNWAADGACLAAVIAATGASVPWDRLVLAWAAGAAAASLAPTPYGLGAVDITLITALHAAGLAAPKAVAAVLLYRVMTFKILGNLISAVYPRLQRTHQTARQASPITPGKSLPDRAMVRAGGQRRGAVGEPSRLAAPPQQPHGFHAHGARPHHPRGRGVVTDADHHPPVPILPAVTNPRPCAVLTDVRPGSHAPSVASLRHQGNHQMCD